MPASVTGPLPAPARQPGNTKRFLLITVIASLGLLLALSHALAAVSLSTTTPATQSFDSIGTSGAATLPADFRVDKQTSARTVGAYASALTATSNVGGANLSTTASNGIYNFGSGTTTTGADRAVGFLSSSSGTNSGNLYEQLVNSTGGPLTGLQISYDVEKYRNGSNAAGFRIQLFYSTDGTTWTNAGTDFTTSFAADANNNGFATAPGATVSVTNKTLNVAVPAGANIYLAWNYSVVSGSTVTNAQALAVDNISILAVPDTTSTPVPTPTPTATPTATPTPTPTPTPTNPAATGSANPNSLQAGSSTVLTVNVTPGANPASTGISVSADLSSIGGLSNQPFTQGSGNTFTYTAGVAPATTPGVKSLPVTVSDGQGRSAGTSISLTVEQPPPPPDHVVISQVYGGGGNTGATYTNDYVELYNPTTSAVTLTGWSIQYGSATGSSWTNKQPLGGDIGPGQYYLVQLGSGGANGQPLPTSANITGDINMSATAGKVALVSNGDSLTGGACPVGTDPDIVDFVGYGSTANCHEGSANAPAPSSSTAIFRKGAGSVDTNQNGSDFATGTPSPRRTAPVVELGPWVASTDPINDGANVPHDATITVGFSEPVDVDPSWFNINCAASGPHNDATVAHTSDFKSYAVTPNVNFQFGEQCTATISKNAIHDQDTDDSAPNTDTLFADYTWSFTVVAAGQPAPYAPEVHLTMGNPSNAAADASQPDNYLMVKPTYALSYNRSKGTPNWVSWHLTSEWYGSLARVDTFRADPAVPADWYRVQATDYFATGFDRGHMTPNADRDNENRVPINQETYLMSNMVPQAPDNNQGPWANFENYLRTLTAAGSDLYIVSGPLGVGGTGSNGGVTTTIANGHVTVPAYTWKVVLVLPQCSAAQVRCDDDVSRVNAATRTIAVLMPNTQGIRTTNSNDWQNYLTTVDNVEQQTGYDFFSAVPAAIQNSIEAGTNGANPPGTADEAASTNEDTPVAIALNAVSPDANATFTYTIVGQPAHGTLSGAGASVTYTPAHDYNGADSFTFKANDGHATSNTSTVTITVNAVNDPPVANNDSASTDEDTPVDVRVLDNDTDAEGDALTVTAFTQGAHGAVANNGGVLTYTPAANYNGSDSFTYTVSDGNGGTATGNVSVTINPVNDPPVAADDSATVDEDSGANSIAVLTNDTDVDGDALTITSVTQGAHGAVAIAGSSVSYAPAHDFNGADAFTYTVSDGHGGTSTATVHVTVNAVNDPPVASAASATTDEDNPVAVQLAATDVDGDPLTFSVVNAPAHGGVTISGGVATYTPAANYNGSDSFTFKANDGQADSNAAAVSIQINPVNDPPVAVNDTAATDEDTPVNVNVLANDTDVDGDTLTITAATQGAHGAVAVAGNSVSYTPAHDFNGADAFTYTVSDGHGGTSTATVHVTVNAVNDPPVAADDAYATDEDTPLTVAAPGLLGNDSDVDSPSLTAVVVAGPAHGALSLNADGSFSYTPAANYNGADSFTYKANDGSLDSAPATVRLTINPVNDAPVANNDSASTDEDTPVSVNVLANDTDVDGDTLSLASVADATHGSVSIVSGKAVFTPDANYNGPASFSYVVSDGHGGTASATVSITVNPVNDPPVANNDSAALDQDTSVSLSVLSNDTDVDGDALVVSAVSQGAHGAVSINPGGGSVTYTPAAGYVGADSFGYTASDNHGGTSTASVSVTVRDTTAPSLNVPDAINAEATSAGGAVVNFVVTASDNSGVAPSIQCTANSGSVFPVGATPVSCQAADASGNKSPLKTFQVSVVDLPPVLTLPQTIIVNSNTAGGATVTFNTAANDTVSGVRPVTCSPASGSLFPVGQTTVNCSATDSAGQTTAGGFLVYVLSSGAEGAAVPAGSDVTVQPEGGPAMTFGDVTTPGVTTVVPIGDPADIGQTPEGFAVSNAVAFRIDTTAAFDAARGVTLAFVVPPVDANGDGVDDLTPADFNAMTVLHNHNGTLEELAVTSRDFSKRTIYAVTHSFSSFYLAQKVNRKIVPLFDKTQGFKAGSTVPVKVKLTDLSGRNLSSPSLVLNARGIRLAGASASSAVNDSGNANPDYNFRFVTTDGGSYIYNLSTKGFAPGRYVLSIYVGKDQFFQTVTFDVK